MHLGNGGKYISAHPNRNIQHVPEHADSARPLFRIMSRNATHVQACNISSVGYRLICCCFFSTLLQMQE